MKHLIILLVAVGFIACNTADQKSGPALSQEEREKAVKDSANFTTIQWIDSSFTDLGKINEGQVVEVSYRFKNSGTKNLIISNVSASCGCTVPEKPERPFAPGEEGVIKAKFDSRGRPAGEQRKSVFVDANTEPQRTELHFRVEIAENAVK
jgi:hypothetical protein